MGRQTQLHMLGGDVQALVQAITAKCDLVVARRYDDVSDINPVVNPAIERDMALWNRDIQPHLVRERIQLNAAGERFCIEYENQILELSNSVQVQWNGRAGLVQGRIYGWDFFDRPEYAKWFEWIQRWIRKNFRKNPFDMGFVGPEAWRWFENGGVLLPGFNPPVTPVWLAEIAKQDSCRPPEHKETGAVS